MGGKALFNMGDRIVQESELLSNVRVSNDSYV